MITEQPEALRLAYMIERYNDYIWSLDKRADYCKAAAELRCQHSEIKRLTAALETANANHEHFERLWHLTCHEEERLAFENRALKDEIKELKDECRNRF